MNSSFTRSSRFGVPIWHAMPHMEFGHVRQTDRQNRTLSHCNFNWGLNPSIYLHASSTATGSPDLPGLGSYFPCHAWVTWTFGHGRSCLPSWNTSARPPAAANRSFLNFFKPLSGWGPASTSSQSLSRRPMLLGNVENWKSPGAEDGTPTPNFQMRSNTSKAHVLSTLATLSLRILQQSKLQHYC